MYLKKLFFAIITVLFISAGFTSCSNDNVADQDALYNNHQGDVDKTKLERPSNG